MIDHEQAINDRPYIDSILAAIAWFDMFEYPLTAWEAWKWRIDVTAQVGAHSVRPPRAIDDRLYSQVMSAMESLISQGRLEQKWSYYFLPGREEIVETRRTRYLLARKKFEKARKVARWFRCMPFMRLIAVCNTLGYSNAADESDIDMFVVAEPGNIWTVRGLCLIFLKLFHLRPRLARFGAGKEERKDKVDLSFFVTADSPDLAQFSLSWTEIQNKSKIPNSNNSETLNFKLFTFNLPNDPYLTYWLAQLTSLWDWGRVYQKLWNANGALRAPVPHAVPYATSPLRSVKRTWISKMLQRFSERVCAGGWMEPAFKLFQMKKMPARIRALAGNSDGVAISDDVLKFHDIDRRGEYRRSWMRSVRALSHDDI